MIYAALWVAAALFLIWIGLAVVVGSIGVIFKITDSIGNWFNQPRQKTSSAEPPAKVEPQETATRCLVIPVRR